MKVNSIKKLDLIILVGGKGSRIKKYLNNNPKPLIKYSNIPFLQLLINYYGKYPFENIFLLTSFKSNKIIEKYHNKFHNLIKITCINEKIATGTGGAIFNIKHKLKNDFILMNGDSFLDVDLSNFFLKKKKIISIFLTHKNRYKSNKKLSSLKIDQQKKIYFDPEGQYMNGGIYFFPKKKLNLFKKKEFSLEDELINNLVKKKEIMGEFSNKFFIDIGTEKNLKISFNKIPSYFNQQSFFFDRDGVINEDSGYVHKKKKFIFRKNILKTLKFLSNLKKNIFIISNQAGIAKKIFKYEDFLILHLWLKKFLFLNGIYLSDIEICPHHPKAKIKKLKKNCGCRKPKNGMVKKIFNKWIINKKNSLFIGDKKKDYLCAKKSNLSFQYVEKDIFNQVKNFLKS